MSAVTLLVAGLALMAAGYFVYSRFIAQKILKLDPNYETPSHAMQDGIDYVPTNKYVLWGHHFTSVAGAALNPADGEWLYWVSVNLDSGETKFGVTPAEHEANVKEYHAWCTANPGKCTS